MIFTTRTGIGYFEDDQGRVVDRYDLPPGEHEASAPRATAVDVQDRANLPDPDPAYTVDQQPLEERIADALDAGTITEREALQKLLRREEP